MIVSLLGPVQGADYTLTVNGGATGSSEGTPTIKNGSGTVVAYVIQVFGSGAYVRIAGQDKYANINLSTGGYYNSSHTGMGLYFSNTDCNPTGGQMAMTYGYTGVLNKSVVSWGSNYFLVGAKTADFSFQSSVTLRPNEIGGDLSCNNGSGVLDFGLATTLTTRPYDFSALAPITIH